MNRPSSLPVSSDSQGTRRSNVRLVTSNPLLSLASGSQPGPSGMSRPISSASVQPSSVLGSSSITVSRLGSNRGLKRPPAVIHESITGTDQDLLSDYLCPICLELIKEAHIISCGHTFCHECLKKSIESSKRCPKCNFTVSNMDGIFPNHLVNKQVLKYKKSLEIEGNAVKKHKAAFMTELKDILDQQNTNIQVDELNNLISFLQNKKEKLMCDAEETKFTLLEKFLSGVKSRKEAELSNLTHELDIVRQDIEYVKMRLALVKPEPKSPSSDSTVPNSCSMSVNEFENSEANTTAADMETCDNNIDGFNVPVNGVGASSIDDRVKRVHRHFEELMESYLSHRVPVLVKSSSDSELSMDNSVHTKIDQGLNNFGNCICKFSQFGSMRPLATIDYAGDKFPASSNIASSIEFDKDGEYFAVAGLTKKIRVFDYGNVIRDVVDIHYPVAEMLCDSKISCVSWSSYLKNKLASSDYDGDVTLWDAFTTQKLHVYKEHQKRCWSVDFNKMDTKLLASGSDDATVKLWYLDSERSLTSIESKTNVCCVQFNPESRYHFAFGSADHSVHYYDLRNMKEPLRLFKGHKKAVSYVKFLSGDEIVSASIDSELKVWNVNQRNCIQSLRGHVNEKNFVGLATDGEYIACGSENNSLCVYYKGLPNKILSFKFDQRRFYLDPDYREDVPSDFVSAVCWRKGSNVLVSGNSQGIIKVLQMV